MNDVVMRDGLADKRGRVCHQVDILGWAKKQVNEASSAHYRDRRSLSKKRRAG